MNTPESTSSGDESDSQSDYTDWDSDDYDSSYQDDYDSSYKTINNKDDTNADFETD